MPVPRSVHTQEGLRAQSHSRQRARGCEGPVFRVRHRTRELSEACVPVGEETPALGEHSTDMSRSLHSLQEKLER